MSQSLLMFLVQELGKQHVPTQTPFIITQIAIIL